MLARSMVMNSAKAKSDSIGDLATYYEIQRPWLHRCPSEVAVSRSGLAALMKPEQVRTLDPLTDSGWDELVAHHPRSSVFHHRGWLKALARTYGYRPVVVTTSPPNSAPKNGLLFCQIDSWLTGSRLVSLPFSDHCEPICDSPEEMISLARGCQAFWTRGAREYLEVRPTSEDFGRTCSEVGFWPVGHYFLHVMDLRPDVEDLFRELR